MSIECPHCKGTINVTITLTAGDPPPMKIMPSDEKPVTAAPATPTPSFRINTDVGRFRQCLHDVGLVVSANARQIYNDKNLASRRIKLDWISLSERAMWEDPDTVLAQDLVQCCREAFGERFIRAEKHGGYGFVLYLDL